MLEGEGGCAGKCFVCVIGGCIAFFFSFVIMKRSEWNLVN